MFKDEPLIKIGRSTWIPDRVEYLSRGYNNGLLTEEIFKPDACYKVDANCHCFVVFPESTLKTLFNEHSTTSRNPFKLMNVVTHDCFSSKAYHTEIFKSHTLPNMIKEIEQMRDELPEAGYKIVSNAPKWFDPHSWRPLRWNLGLINTQSETVKNLGTLISVHRQASYAFQAKEEFRLRIKEPIRTQFVKLKIGLWPGSDVLPDYVAGPAVEDAYQLACSTPGSIRHNMR